MPRYTYTSPLDISRIRLLHFDNTSTNFMGLRIFMNDYPLNNLPSDHALSYTWGPPQKFDQDYEGSGKLSIALNGQIFEVFPNLYHALSVLKIRQKFLPRFY